MVGLFTTNYTLDNIGRIIQINESVLGDSNVFRYTYDLSGRLEQVFRNDTLISTYSYDSNGNRLSHATLSDTLFGMYDDQDRMLAYGDAVFSYTANGSLIWKSENGDTTWYDYDLLGNLISVTLTNGDIIEYLIDGQNRRVGKLVNGQFKKGWLYQDRLNPVAELDSTGNIISRFVYGTKAHVPDYMIKGDSTYRFITDHLGSVRLVVNVETGTVAQRIDYDEFGNVLLNTNPDFQPFAYAGGLYDTQTELVRFGARDYDAGVGRWTGKEPLGFLGGNNHYIYAFGNPIIFIDINGLEVEIVIWEPSGWGGSSFGHVSVNIDGIAYSFGRDGKMHSMSREEYMSRNEFRKGIGFVLDINSCEQDAIEQFLSDYSGKYIPGINSCQSATQEALSEIGYDVGSDCFPPSLGHALIQSGLVRDYNFYEQSVEERGSSAPWAK